MPSTTGSSKREGDEAHAADVSSSESLLTHVSPSQPPSPGGTVVLDGNSLQSAIEAAMAEAIGSSLRSLSESVRDIKKGQARLEERLNAIDLVVERVARVENAVRTITKKQESYDGDWKMMDGHLQAMAQRVAEVEKSAEFLSNVVEEAAAERENLSRTLQKVRDAASPARTRSDENETSTVTPL